MQLSLTPELEQAVLAKVKSGLYRDEADVIYDALRHFLHEEQEQWPLELLRREVAKGAEQLEAGLFSQENIMDIALRMEKAHSRDL